MKEQINNRWNLRRIAHLREHIENVKDKSFNGELDLALGILKEWEKEERGRVRKDDKG